MEKNTDRTEGVQSISDDTTEKEKVPANAEKRARVFDLNAMLEETKKTAQVRHSEVAAKAAEAEAIVEAFDEKNVKGRDEDGVVDKNAKRSDNGSSVSGDTGESDDDDLMPSLPPGFAIPSTSEEPSKEGDSDDEEFSGYANEGVSVMKLIPAACEASIQHGDKPVTAICFNQPGARFMTGGLDCQVCIFDFQKMDKSLKPDRQIHPCDNNVITHLSFSPNGENILVCNGSAQVKLLDRRGTQFGETVRGDKYLIDLSNTKGHTATVNCSAWNPIVKGEFITCSDDGTIRIWSLEDFKDITRQINKQKKLIKTKNANGKRAMPQTCVYSRDGKSIACGCDDGSIQMWKHGKMFVNTTYLVRKAHSAPITCIAFSPDSKKILSRSLDDSLKLWSIEDNKTPLRIVNSLETGYKSTDCGWSPRGELVFTCVSSPSKDHNGALVFYDPLTFEMVYKIEYPGLSVIRATWHARLNQILIGLSDGSLRLYYDTNTSHSGALVCVTRPLRRARQQEVMKEEMVLSPLALEMFQARGEEGVDREVTAWRLKKYLRQRDNELRPEFRKPADMPMSGPSAGGRVASSGGTLHSYVAQQMGRERNKDFLEDNDVRASILKHAEAAEKEPLYINKAYRKTQPVTIFASTTTEEDEEEEEDSVAAKKPKLH